MYIDNMVYSHAFKALPFLFLRDYVYIALMAINTIALRALFRLEDYKFTDAAHKVIHCQRKLGGYKVARAYIR